MLCPPSHRQMPGQTQDARFMKRQLTWPSCFENGTSLIVGDSTTFPHCMQHQVANLAGSLNGSPPVLSGAAVEGPNSIAAKGTLSGMIACPTDGVDVFAQFNGKAVYKDFVQSYSTVEPAIDLTASSFLAFSWQIAGAPSGTP